MPIFLPSRVRWLVLLLAVALGALVLWRTQAMWAGWLPGPARTVKPIVFDNGSVRERPAPAAPDAVTAKTSLPPGAMRKCVKGREVVYTQVPCASGFKEMAVGGTPVNVVTTPSARPLDAVRSLGREAQGHQEVGAQRRLQQVLDIERNDRMREKAVDRVVNDIR